MDNVTDLDSVRRAQRPGPRSAGRSASLTLHLVTRAWLAELEAAEVVRLPARAPRRGARPAPPSPRSSAPTDCA